MAEEQKPVDVAAQAAETIQNDTVAAAAPAPALDDKAVEEAKPAADETKTEEPKAEEPKAEETKPVEEGHLGYKAQGLSFPKNLIPSKEFFFFGNEALEAKTLETYKKAEKHAEHALNNIAWATHTGKGLLFAGEKKAPTGVINLSDASEPEVDGSNKFHLTAKGSKHTFKATNAAERDNWVAQIKAKIAEAKELAASVTESETYKNTLESFKPAPKEEKPAEAAKEEPKADEAKTEDAPKEEGEAAKEEPKAEEPKRRSASRKRASFFGFGKKDLPKADEAAPAETATEDKAVDAEAPKVEESAETPAAAAAPAEAAAEEKPAEEAESPKEKPVANKRNSIFGNVFSKKEKKPADAKPADAAEAEETAVTTEEAPVIPPVESTTPLADEVNAETADVAATNGEAKKDIKEKRKSSLPFAFGKREKSPAPVNGEEKPKSGAFSKFRATIKGKGAKVDEAKETATKTEDAAQEEPAKVEEAVKDEPAAVKEDVTKALEETENKPENAAATTPAVTAAA